MKSASGRPFGFPTGQGRGGRAALNLRPGTKHPAFEILEFQSLWLATSKRYIAAHSALLGTRCGAGIRFHTVGRYGPDLFAGVDL